MAFKLYNNDGTLTVYAFGCGCIERTAWDFGDAKPWCDVQRITDNMVDLDAANISIGLYNIKVYLNGNFTWLQRSGLVNARKCQRKAKAVVKKFVSGKLAAGAAQAEIDKLGFED